VHVDRVTKSAQDNCKGYVCEVWCLKLDRTGNMVHLGAQLINYYTLSREKLFHVM